jgi:two-component system, OmpR family, sensor kinase
LVIARTVDGRVPVERAPIALAGLISERVQAFSGFADERDVEVVEHVADVVVELDPTRLRQAVDNLLDNAIRHSPNGGRVAITATIDADSVSIIVEDEGPGFGEAALAAAFQPFNRAASHASGAGLGLALAHAVAQAHGGGAEAGNRPTGGAAVTLRLRVSATGRAAEPDPNPPPVSGRA